MLVAEYDNVNDRDHVSEAQEAPRLEGFFELSILRAEDNVRIALLFVLLLVALTSPVYVVNRVSLFTALIVGVFLTMWTRYGAQWAVLRAAGHVRIAAGVVLLGEYAWLALFVHGTGGLDSPFSALLLLPVIFASAFFSLLNIAVALSTGLILVTLGIFALSPQVAGQADTGWQLIGMLMAVIAVAWGSYGLCRVLERERRTNDLVVRYLSEGVLLIDGLGWVRLCNHQMERFLGMPAQEVLRINTRQIAQQPELAQLGDVLHGALIPGSYAPTHVRDVSIFTPEPTDLRVITMRLSSGADKSMGWLVVCQDVTELKSLVRMREDGVRFLSHEIRSPLTTLRMISGVFSDLAEQLSDRSSVKLIEVMDDEVDRMLRLVGQFLDIAALDQGTYSLKPGVVVVPELLEKAESSLEVRASTHGVSISTRCDGQIPTISADLDALENCLHNLCDNALKHTRRGDEISLTAWADGDYVQIAVADTGYGIPAELHESIFDEFVQRGSTFTIHLPIAGPPQQPA